MGKIKRVFVSAGRIAWVTAVSLCALIMGGDIALAAWGGGGGGALGALYCKLTGGADCVMTGQIRISGVTDDITTVSNQDLRLAPNGTGDVISEGGENIHYFATSDGTVRGYIEVTTGGLISIWQGTGSGAGLISSGSVAFVGSEANRTSFQKTFTVVDQLSVVSTGGASLSSFYGAGGRGVELQHEITIADDGAGTSPTDTSAPTSEHVEITCNDANNCSWAPVETSVPDGWTFTAMNVSAANTVTVADSAGVLSVTGGASKVLAANESIMCSYTGSIFICQ